VANRHDIQNIYHLPPPKKDDKPKADPVAEAFGMLLTAAVLLFFGAPLFCLMLRLALEFWFPHAYRYYP
jgi:hypothetical protein